MNTDQLRLSATFAVSSLAAIARAACVVAGGGPGYGGDVGVGYYEPVGGVYGIWGPGYEVGPYRDGSHGWGGGHGQHAYRGSGGGRSVPSIPSRGRGRR